jgi:hypothetical protein
MSNITKDIEENDQPEITDTTDTKDIEENDQPDITDTKDTKDIKENDQSPETLDTQDKQRVCLFFLKGNCLFGDKCDHLHPTQIDAQIREQIPLCKFYQQGRCKFGDKCLHRHDTNSSKRLPPRVPRANPNSNRHFTYGQYQILARPRV